MNIFGMKKYLMTGMAAVVFGGLFTSCSHDIEDGGSTQEQIQKTYEKAFVTRFGQPVADLDWGFGSTQANTREENANANEWADPDKEYGGLLVPPPLTDEQIAVVKEYFQSVKNIPYNDPQWTNFFIQQVYKGHTGAKTGPNPAYNEPYSPEAYMALNGTTELYASDYMDHLAAINDEVNPEFVDHINNFNHGDCGENDHVLKKGGNANDGPFYTDKIMYMKNSTTKSFGYYNSNGSLRHTEYTGLVSWTTIRDWANEHNLNGNCLADGWNRSFMGFDFEQMIDDQCYATEWVNGVEVAKTLRFNQYSAELIINGETPTNYVYQYNGQPVKMLSDQMNRYCGVKIDVTDEQLYTDLYDADNNNAYIGKQLNTDFIDGLLAQGYLPIDNKSLREWAIVGGCADGYYSDWIVTLTEAKTENKPQGLRIIAEDLNAKAQEGDIEDSDWDFNDVVFDVTFPADDKAEITLVAAGGTLPLIVGVLEPENGKAYPENEVHRLFGVDVDYMVNTINKTTHPNLKGGAPVNAAPKIQFTLTGVKAANGKTIPIHVEKVINGQKVWVELEAPEGKPAAKIGVDPTTFNFCLEKVDIRSQYPLFTQWVRTTNPSFWWTGNY